MINAKKWLRAEIINLYGDAEGLVFDEYDDVFFKGKSWCIHFTDGQFKTWGFDNKSYINYSLVNLMQNYHKRKKKEYNAM